MHYHGGTMNTVTVPWRTFMRQLNKKYQRGVSGSCLASKSIDKCQRNSAHWQKENGRDLTQSYDTNSTQTSPK